MLYTVHIYPNYSICSNPLLIVNISFFTLNIFLPVLHSIPVAVMHALKLRVFASKLASTN
jgi:hypothetical protein